MEQTEQELEKTVYRKPIDNHRPRKTIDIITDQNEENNTYLPFSTSINK
jgi:hypothetical protein